jgi:hypothetical protein
MEQQHESHFYLTILGWKQRRIIYDCKKAGILLNWYQEHVVREFIGSEGRRYGRVAWHDSVTDFSVSLAISRDGTSCSAWTVRKWRRTLRRLGYITWRQTRSGLIIFVLNSDKFPDGDKHLKPALPSDEALISAAFALRDARVSGQIMPV